MDIKSKDRFHVILCNSGRRLFGSRFSLQGSFSRSSYWNWETRDTESVHHTWDQSHLVPELCCICSELDWKLNFLSRCQWPINMSILRHHLIYGLARAGHHCHRAQAYSELHHRYTGHLRSPAWLWIYSAWAQCYRRICTRCHYH